MRNLSFSFEYYEFNLGFFAEYWPRPWLPVSAILQLSLRNFGLFCISVFFRSLLLPIPTSLLFIFILEFLNQYGTVEDELSQRDGILEELADQLFWQHSPRKC